jgi:hypothetical protein
MAGRHVGVHETGRHGGDRDPVRGQRDGERLAERVQARLAGAVSRLAGLAAERPAGGDVDDPPATPGDHVLDRAPGHVGGTGEVDGQRLLPGRLPLLVGHLGHRVGGEHARVVDQHVQATQCGAGLVHHLPHRLRVRQVGPHQQVAAAGQAGQHRGGLAR